MPGYCETCGRTLDKAGSCLSGPHDKRVDGPAGQLVPPSVGTIVGPLPKASIPRRFLGSGIEYVAYLTLVWVVTLLDTFSAGVLGILALLPIGLIVLRDANGGALSVAKRVSQMRVVDRNTGQPASNAQGLMRNSYYLAPLILALLLPWADLIVSFLFSFFMFIDLLMILAGRRGWRLGDHLAGTQVVETGS